MDVCLYRVAAKAGIARNEQVQARLSKICGTILTEYVRDSTGDYLIDINNDKLKCFK